MNIDDEMKEPSWQKRRQIPDPQVLDAADQFDNARRLLAAQPPGAGVFQPTMHNAAIALELYLKSLLAVTIHTPVPGRPVLEVVTAEVEPPDKIHDSTCLLKSIPADVQKSLEEAYAAAHAGKTLHDALTPYDKPFFTASRYAFEKGKPKIDKDVLDELMDLCSFLRGVHV